MLLSLIFGLIVGALAVMFALQNIFPVTVTFLTWHVTSSLAVLIALSVLVGIVIFALLSIPESIKNSFAISRLRTENKKLNDQLEMVHLIKSEASVVTPVETIVIEREV